MDVKFDNVAVSVTDVAASADWYSQLFGFKLGYQTHLAPLNADFAVLERDDIRIELISQKGVRRHEDADIDPPHHLAKMNLRLDTGAVACDMEGSRLLRLLGQMEDRLPEVHVILCKVVGDLPEDYFLFQLEDQIRSWSQRTRWEKLRVFLRYPGNALRLNRLFRVKRRALDSLTGRMGALVRRLYREGRVAQDMDSVFIPH